VSLDSAFESPQAKRQYVRKLFAIIADRYDLITAVLSYGQDARWKAKLVALADVRPGRSGSTSRIGCCSSPTFAKATVGKLGSRIMSN
jgi:hypothetical protein